MTNGSAKTPKEKLDLAFAILLNPKTAEEHYKSKSFLLYICRLLGQNKITDVETKEVFTEVYIRAAGYIDRKNLEIKNPNAFLKRVAVNYINEIIREKIKRFSYDPTILEDQIDPSQTQDESYLEGFSQDNLKRFSSVLEKLSWSDKEILRLWKIEDQKWKDIVIELDKRGECLSVDSAKKRGERLMKRLRKEMEQ